MKNYIGISRDHSGSMRSLVKNAAADYNSNIENIKMEANKHNIDTIVSVVRCGVGLGGRVEREIVNSNVHMLKPITDYIANGTATPLFDSVGDLINQFQNVPDVDDENVSFLIMAITDGGENSSKFWDKKLLSERIAQLQRTDRWTFVFRVPKGNSKYLLDMGIPEGNILEWELTSKGMNESSVMTATAFSDYYSARSAGVKSTSRFYADLTNVSKTEVKRSLDNISGSVDTLVVPTNNILPIKEFIESLNIPYVKGTVFYKLTKTENVQPNKKIIIRDKTNGSIYTGYNARLMLNLPSNVNVKLSPGTHGLYDIYVQSTSVNRKLVGGTDILLWRGAVK